MELILCSLLGNPCSKHSCHRSNFVFLRAEYNREFGEEFSFAVTSMGRIERSYSP